MTPAAYDFARPAGLPADWVPRLERWFRSALTIADRSSARELAFPITSELAGVDLAKPAPLYAELGEGGVGYRLQLGAERFPSVLLVPRTLLLALVNGLIGDVPQGPEADRELTLVEQNLAEYFLLAHWLPAFKTSWPGTTPPVWQQGPGEPIAEVSRAFSAEERAVTFTWKVQGPFGEVRAHWLYRMQGFGELLGFSDGSAAAKAAPAPSMETLVQGLPIEVVVQLGTAALRLSQLSSLQAGDVILLNQRISDPLVGRVGDMPKFLGWAGRAGSVQAFQIQSLAEG